MQAIEVSSGRVGMRTGKGLVLPFRVGRLVGARLGSRILADPEEHEVVPAEDSASCREALARRYPGMKDGFYRGGWAGC